ncbi:MAG: hypothetical protein P0Y65_16330 [Candidatus Devosia phytovorans]|uniref:Uncharacterized protein n=1 Tax=Candidatus Devosia phytovorans TaxID=3121372 RepID=A0AAJ5VT87_9HYPH|nr:hypothetical protein [Devosia sp.]WEK03745.1 MAG: hypothetical protein P0Y65_16330 [Devosia sp.]
MTGAVQAADLTGYRAGICISHSDSALASQSTETIRQTVWANFESAKTGMSDPQVLASNRSAFVWAMEARWACATAAGYLKGGNVDVESVEKCDCFHQRYESFR